MEEQIQKCVEQLKPILEKEGSEVFCSAVQELLNTHESSKPFDCWKSWEILLLPSGYDPDAVLSVTYQAATEAYQEQLNQKLGDSCHVRFLSH